MKPAKLKKFTAALLFAFPLLIQIPYAMLTATFDYPHILRESASVILTRYAAAGPAIPLAWYLYGICIVPLLVAITLLPSVLDAARPLWLRVAAPLGVASAILQILGLLRWVVLVPLLADAYTLPDATATSRAAIEIGFQVQHQLFGVLMGEHIGQILLAFWTAGVTMSLPTTTRAYRVLRALGVSAAALFLAGSGGSLGSVFPNLSMLEPLPGIAFLVWSVWCAMLGWLIYVTAGVETRAASFPATVYSTGAAR